MRMASKEALETCDFTGSTTLAPTTSSSYYLPCATPGESIYLSCSVSNHCAMGQRLTVHVSPSLYAVDTSGLKLIHVQSLSRVYTLLGRRAESNGYVYLDRGYKTEAQASESLDLVWCLETHCPSSAQDWDPSATEASCKAEVNNLAGYISRKRPTPQYVLSEKYYLAALAHVPTHCPTLSYLSELYVMTTNQSAATAAALRLCGTCGAAAPVTLQAKAAFDASTAIAWPTTGACDPSPPPPPPSPPPSLKTHSVTFQMTVSGSVDDFDTASFKTALASTMAGVSASDIQLTLASASVRVTIVITTGSAASATSIADSLTTLTADIAACSTLLGVTIETVSAPQVASIQSTSTSGGGGGGGAGIAIGAAAGGVCVLVAIAAWVWYMRSRSPQRPQKTVQDAEKFSGTGATKRSKGAVGAAELVGPVPSTVDLSTASSQTPPPSPPASKSSSPPSSQPPSRSASGTGSTLCIPTKADELIVQEMDV